jgi:hypothetical protein
MEGQAGGKKSTAAFLGDPENPNMHHNVLKLLQPKCPNEKV